ncbi:MAG: polysaccharide deacetylase family protein [Bauldia sp.]
MRAFALGVVVASVVSILPTLPAFAFCTNPDALGVSRVLPLDTAQGLEIGRNGFHHPAPLGPKEVVLTFDDGPEPGTTDAVLRALDKQCTRATFFIVGRMAQTTPSLVLAAEAAGHTIATHTHGHPLAMHHLALEDAVREIDTGIRDVTAVLGHAPVPFFRFPGLRATTATRAYLAERGIAAVSIDAEGGDWLPFSSPDSIRLRALAQLRHTNGGILLLHDTKAATAAMLPQLLADLKAEGFKIVHIVPSEESLVAAANAAPAPAKRVQTAALAPTLAGSSARPPAATAPVRAATPTPWLFPWQRPPFQTFR